MICKSTASLQRIFLGTSAFDILLRVLCSGCLVPLLSDLVLPVRILLNLVDAVLNDGECLSHLKVVHVLLVVELVCELKEVVDLLLLLLLDVLLCQGPCRLLLLTLLAWRLRFLCGLPRLRLHLITLTQILFGQLSWFLFDLDALLPLWGVLPIL